MRTNRTIIIAEIAILAALALGLDYIANLLTGSLFAYGGSISISLVPIMVISFRRGIIPGLVCGLIVGIIQVIWGGYVFQFFQFILDYPVPYTLVGLAGIFAYFNKGKLTKINIILGGIVAGLLRYFSHFLAGVTFWRAYAPEEFTFFGKTIKGFNPFTWSIFYNGLYMIPTIILSTTVLYLLYKTANHLFYSENN